MLIDNVGRWYAGDEIVLAWPGGIALVDASVGVKVGERLWSRLRRDSQLGVFFKTLAEGSESGFLDLPSFAIAIFDRDKCHVAVRGAVPVRIQKDDHVEIVSGEGITTWAEKVLVSPDAIGLGCFDGEAAGGAVADGVISAGGISLGRFSEMASGPTPSAHAAPHSGIAPDDPEQHQSAAPGGGTGVAGPVIDVGVEPAEPLVVGSAEREADEAPAAEELDEASVPDSSHESEELQEPVVAEDGREDGGPEPISEFSPPEIDGEIAQGPVPEVQTPAPRAAETTLAEVPIPAEILEQNPYESLWDHSIAMDIEAAAIRGEIEEVNPGGSSPSGSKPSSTDTNASTSGSASSDQLSGDTVFDAGVVNVVMHAQPQGPQVLARFCDQGHPNPPERATCFVCGEEVGGEAKTTTRPQLGWLRVEGGETIPLRGPVIAGRNPKSTAVKLDESPRLVALPHPHVSGTHLAILIEGWHILVKDLHSSNGTYLRRHGKPPVRLPETAVPLVAGDLIDLGKGLYIHLDRTP